MLWALATLEIRPPELWLEAFVEESFTQLPYAAPQHFSNLVAGFSKLGRLPPEAWQDRFFLETRPQLLAFKAPELAQMMYAFGVSRVTPPQQWMSQFMMATHAKAEFLTPHGLANLMFGVSRIGFRPNPKWLASMADTAVTLTPAMTALDISTILTAFEKLGHAVPPEFAALGDDAVAAVALLRSGSGDGDSESSVTRATGSRMPSAAAQISGAFLAPSHVRTILHARERRGASARAGRSLLLRRPPPTPPTTTPALPLTGAEAASLAGSDDAVSTGSQAASASGIGGWSSKGSSLPTSQQPHQRRAGGNSTHQQENKAAGEARSAMSGSPGSEGAEVQQSQTGAPVVRKGKKVSPVSAFPLLLARTFVEGQQAPAKPGAVLYSGDGVSDTPATSKRGRPSKAKAAAKQPDTDAAPSSTLQPHAVSSKAEDASPAAATNLTIAQHSQPLAESVGPAPHHSMSPLLPDLLSTATQLTFDVQASEPISNHSSQQPAASVSHTASDVKIREEHAPAAAPLTMAQAPFYVNEDLRSGSKRRNTLRKKLAAAANVDTDEE